MLTFWKKSGHNDKKICSSDSFTSNPVTCSSRTPCVEKSENTCRSFLSALDVDNLSDIEDGEDCGKEKERSRLSKNLHEVLLDKSVLGYFLQYMESRGAAVYLLCWLEVDTFKSDAKERVASISRKATEHDSLSVSTDCDSLTCDTSSLCDGDISLGTGTFSDSRLTFVEDKFPACDTDSSDTSLKCKHESLVPNTATCDKKMTQQLIDRALLIFKKYIAQEASSNIKSAETLRRQVIENLCDTSKVLQGACFDDVQSYLYETLESEYFDAFLSSDYYCKYQIDMFTSGNVTLDDILYNETALFYFMEFLEQENDRALLEFWITATNFQQQLRSQGEFYDSVEAQNDAVVLYDKYLSLQAHCPLGFSDKVRLIVEQNICGEQGVNMDCFRFPLKIVEHVLGKHYLKSFLSSQLFYKYLSDLINSVQSSGYATNIEKKASPSDCSSERSFSTNSTFLALEVPQSRHLPKKQEKHADMTIDTRELYDPDSLWKRRHHHKLICGRVSHIGKYETDFEPEPVRKEFNLKSVVKKFVSLDDEDKKKEDMAWQVAEMIVKDITNITLNDQKDLHL